MHTPAFRTRKSFNFRRTRVAHKSKATSKAEHCGVVHGAADCQCRSFPKCHLSIMKGGSSHSESSAVIRRTSFLMDKLPFTYTNADLREINIWACINEACSTRLPEGARHPSPTLSASTLPSRIGRGCPCRRVRVAFPPEVSTYEQMDTGDLELHIICRT